jgi:hypothetical protein
MRCFLLLWCVILAGCSKNSNQGSSTQPSGPLKKDPGIDAAVYALQTIDYVEKYIENPSAMHKEDDAFIKTAVDKIPPTETELRDELGSLYVRVLDLGKEQIFPRDGKEAYATHIGYFHIARDQAMDKIKKIAAQRNALVELRPENELEVAHPPDPKWERRNVDEEKVVFYTLQAKNAIIYQDSSKQDLEARPKLTITCASKEQVSISVDTWVETEKVRLKFDAEAPVQERWHATNTFIYSPRSGQLFSRLKKAKTFAIELTPHRKNPQTVIFSLADFKDTAGDDRDCHLH